MEGLRSGQAKPQQIVRIRKLYNNLGRLRCRVELVGSGDEVTLERILIPGWQHQVKFTALGRLLETCEFLAALKILVGRSLADPWIGSS